MNITGLFERRSLLKAGALLGGLSGSSEDGCALRHTLNNLDAVAVVSSNRDLLKVQDSVRLNPIRQHDGDLRAIRAEDQRLSGHY